MNFARFNLSFLCLGMVCSLAGWAPLDFLALFYWVGVVFFSVKASRSQALRKPDRESIIGIGLCAIYSVFVWLWLRDVWVAPSNDDTINHLSILRSILDQKTLLIGQTLKPGAATGQ